MAEFKAYRVTMELEVHTNVPPSHPELGSRLTEDIVRMLDEGDITEESIHITDIELSYEYD